MIAQNVPGNLEDLSIIDCKKDPPVPHAVYQFEFILVCLKGIGPKTNLAPALER